MLSIFASGTSTVTTVSQALEGISAILVPIGGCGAWIWKNRAAKAREKSRIVEASKTAIDELRADLVESYDARIAEQKTQYEARIADLNSQITYWKKTDKQ